MASWAERVKPVTSRAGKPSSPARQKGFTYLLVLGVIVVVSIMAQVATTSTTTLVRRANEQELLFRGDAYRQAIRAYYEAIPSSPQYPASLEELASDPRFPHRRHIRQLYAEPLSGEWRVLRNEQGRIVGVASSSGDEPMKKSGFRGDNVPFEGAEAYSDWEFAYLPSSVNANVNPVTKPLSANP